ncbi:serine/threonine-protein kinase [Nocardia seriolae]|uniref:serine/threonine-protein kinase n=1 Tax=Nocardia seriolae TaxID=37332 RepID=UPI002954D95C|nr:serine/threonine-protein kinase [Nocardia seriolae]BEK90898.1 hypothetical protein NSERKGN1266_68490 [Nocardia seriolae]
MGDGYLGRYRLDELLGSGGSAEVWRAHDTVADRTVTLKMLAPVLTADREYRERFEREARAASLLHGPHVVAVHTFGELEGRLFIDSEFVDGLDIEALLEWEGPMDAAAAVALIAQIADALDEAHAAGLIHRDIKPQNIIVAPDDVAYLIDFGTALQDGQTAITQTGMLVGTPAYMAPERFEGAASPRSDIYSLGCVLYECLTGARPFRMRNPAQLMRAHLDRTPEPPPPTPHPYRPPSTPWWPAPSPRTPATAIPPQANSPPPPAPPSPRRPPPPSPGVQWAGRPRDRSHPRAERSLVPARSRRDDGGCPYRRAVAERTGWRSGPPLDSAARVHHREFRRRGHRHRAGSRLAHRACRRAAGGQARPAAGDSGHGNACAAVDSIGHGATGRITRGRTGPADL